MLARLTTKTELHHWLLAGALALVTTLLPVTASGNEEPSIQFHSFKTHSRLSFRIDDGVAVQSKEIPNGFELVFSNTTLTDFGAPLGVEDQWKRQFETFHDSHLASLKIIEAPEGVKILGKWRFDTGPSVPAVQRMERFDYRNSSPAQYVFDFWPKDGPTRSQLRSYERRTMALAEQRKSEAEAQKRAQRKIASEKALDESDEINKFCHQPLSETTDVFLPFLPIHEPIKLTRWFSVTTPDASYIYANPIGKEDDDRYVRIALGLYRQGKPALVIRTLDFLDAEFPQSKHHNEMQFLRANALIKLGLQDEALRILKSLMSEAKDSMAALQTGLYLATDYMEKGQNLMALETFSWLTVHYPNHPLTWVFHLGTAECFYLMKQTSRALKDYEWVALHAPDKESKAEGGLRQGDLYLARFQYEQALAEYFHALDRFPEESKNFPAIYINRAESLYWLGQYDRALTAFQQFLEDFPGHPSGWRATLRIAEIHGRRPGAQEAVEMHKWLYDTANRFPFSPGATLARIRMLPCGDHGGLDPLTSERFFSTEAARFDGNGEIRLDHYNDYVGLAYIRSLVSLGQESRAVEVAIDTLKKDHYSQTREAVATLFRRLFRKSILAMLAQGKKYEALNFYFENYRAIPKDIKDIDPDYLIKLSQAASDLEMGQWGKQLAELYDVQSKSQAKDRVPASGPAQENAKDDPEQHIKVAETQFTQAKAIWISSRMAEEATVRKHLSYVGDDSTYAYEREIILGIMDESSGKSTSALAHAMSAQLLMPMAGGGDPRIMYWVAYLQEKVGDKRMASQMYRDLQRRITAKNLTEPADSVAKVLGVKSVPALDHLILAEGALLEKQGRWGEAAAAYGRAVDIGMGGHQMIYQFALALSKTSNATDRVKSREMLQKLTKDGDDDFWKKLAREALADNDAKEGRK